MWCGARPSGSGNVTNDRQSYIWSSVKNENIELDAVLRFLKSISVLSCATKLSGNAWKLQNFIVKPFNAFECDWISHNFFAARTEAMWMRFTLREWWIAKQERRKLSRENRTDFGVVSGWRPDNSSSRTRKSLTRTTELRAEQVHKSRWHCFSSCRVQMKIEVNSKPI